MAEGRNTQWHWVAGIAFALIIIWATVGHCADAETHGQVKMFYEQRFADGETEESSFSLEQAKVWLDKDYSEGTSARLTLEFNQGAVDVREAFVSTGFSTILRGKAGIFENRFGTSDYWADYGYSPWIGPSESYARLGIPIPVADLGAGVEFRTGILEATVAVLNGNGYQNVEVNEDKDFMTNIRLNVCDYFSAGGSYYRTPGEGGYAFTGLNGKVGWRSLMVTGEYITRADPFTENDDGDPHEHAWIFTSEVVLADKLGLVSRVEVRDAASAYALDEDGFLVVAGAADFDAETVGLNFYPTGTGGPVAQFHITTTDFDTRLQSQLAWQF